MNNEAQNNRAQALLERYRNLIHRLQDLSLTFADFHLTRRGSLDELRNLQEEITGLSTAISILEAADPSLVNKMLTNQANTQKDTPKDLQKIAERSKKFQPKITADNFWREFQRSCSFNNLSDQESIRLLKILVADHEDARNWFTMQVEFESRFWSTESSMTLRQVKDSFYSKFLPTDWKNRRFQELVELKFRPLETVPEFCNRFAAKMIENDMDVKSEDPSTNYTVHVLFYKCPSSVQRVTGTRTPSDFKSCHELIEQWVKFSGVPPDISLIVPKCLDCGRQPSCLCYFKRKEIPDASRTWSPAKRNTPGTRRNEAPLHSLSPLNPLGGMREGAQRLSHTLEIQQCIMTFLPASIVFFCGRDLHTGFAMICMD